MLYSYLILDDSSLNEILSCLKYYLHYGTRDIFQHWLDLTKPVYRQLKCEFYLTFSVELKG